MKLRYYVITNVNDTREEYAIRRTLSDKTSQWTTHYTPLEQMSYNDSAGVLAIRVPAFRVGEIVIVDEDENPTVEAGGLQRNLALFDITYEVYDNPVGAVVKAREVIDNYG